MKLTVDSVSGEFLVKLGRFVRRPVFIQAWLLPVWFLLGMAKLAIFTVSFRRLLPFIGQPAGALPWVPLLSAASEARARQIGEVVRTAARYTPWDSNCFPQAIVSRLLLGLYGIDYCVFFGVRRGSGQDPFDAHAWIAAGRVAVVGKRSFRDYTVVGVFASPKLLREMPHSSQF